LTNTAISSARRYWENKDRLLSAVNVSIAAAVTVFPEEIYQAPRSWTERAYHKLIYFDEVDEGGHFAAWKQPELFSAELRDGFRSQHKPILLCCRRSNSERRPDEPKGQIANCRAIDTQRRIFRQSADLLESAGTAVFVGSRISRRKTKAKWRTRHDSNV
jgi:hypothetical protein